MKIKPVLKWAGGKAQLIDEIICRMPADYKTYYEPFLGAGALLFALQPSVAVVNDINPQLINIYNQIEKNHKEIISLINDFDSIECNKERYYEFRAKYNEKINNNVLDAECAALMIWINKHCFNGLYRVNSKGLFNVPYNNRTVGKSIEAENVQKMGQYLKDNNIVISNIDFEEACNNVKKGDFVYFDSPYVPLDNKDSFTDYSKTGFLLEDHKRLAKLYKRLDKIGAYVMLSNHDTSLVRELYEGFKIDVVSVKRFINSDATNRKGTEVIITNYKNEKCI